MTTGQGGTGPGRTPHSGSLPPRRGPRRRGEEWPWPVATAFEDVGTTRVETGEPTAAAPASPRHTRLTPAPRSEARDEACPRPGGGGVIGAR